MLLDSKSNLAKLMATENIIVEQKKASTAHFNLKTRTLVIPILKEDLSTNLYDLFIGHEVGHALNTPEDGWHDSISDCGVNRSILNVCEDVRIEKLIRRKFPGLKISFIKAYRELLDQDFFGIKGYDLNALRLIDRINLHTKAGASLGIKFTSEETALLVETEEAETFPQTVEVAKKIQQFMKDQREKQKEEPVEEDEEEQEESDFETEEADDDDEAPGYDEIEDAQSDGPSELGDGWQSSIIKDYEKDESITDINFRDNEKQLYQETKSDLSYVNIPELKSENYIVGYKHIYKTIRELTKKPIENNFIKFRKDTNKVVSYLTKEFELRKNADQLKRASIAKTGDLNMQRIFSYQFADDIFKKISIVPNGKSHGLVLFLDWSGSMSRYMDDTIRQLLTLVLFCKNVQIPFEVYAFSTQWPLSEEFKQTYKEGDVILGKVSLLNILSNRMTSTELSYAADCLLDKVYNAYGDFDNLRDLMLGATPLNETIMLAMDIIPKFQSKNKLQVVNTVFLTDGEGHALTEKFTTKGFEYMNTSSIVVRDPVTHVSMKANYSWHNTSKAFLHILKQRTGCNMIGFRILGNAEFRNYMYNEMKGVNTDMVAREFRGNKYYVVGASGFDEYYLLKSDGLSTEEEELTFSSTTTRGLVSSFKKYSKSHIQNRVILNRFIGLIS